MKKILLIIATLLVLSSCTLEPDTQQDFFVEFLPADSITVPEFVSHGHTYEIKVAYTKPNGCYLFERFHTEHDGEAVLIAVQSVVKPDNICAQYVTPESEERSFTFQCNATYTAPAYIFKFYTGLDSAGNKTYTQVEIPIK